MPEKHMINYRHDVTYSNTALNAIGATTSTTLRTITTPAAGTTNYVRKFGTQYLITDVTNLSDPAVANLTWYWYALDGTLMGSRANGGAFVDGSVVSSQGCYLVASASGGAATLPASMTVTTDVDVGGRTIYLPQETVADGASLTLYVADSGSTYYDTTLMYGGARHTPAVGDSRLAYFDIGTAYAALAARTIVHVLDSATYDEELDLNTVSTLVQAALGQTPTITKGVGQRTSREVQHDGNNADTAYVSKTGNDGNPGTYQSPYLTITAAFAGIGARTYINIMDSGTYTESLAFTSGITFEPIYGKTPKIVGKVDTDSNCVFSGLYIDSHALASDEAMEITTNPNTTSVYDCTIYASQQAGSGIYAVSGGYSGTISNVRILRAQTGIGVTNGSATITKCIVSGCIYTPTGNGIVVRSSGANASTTTVTNCICFSNNVGIALDAIDTSTLGGTLENNTCVYNTIYGMSSFKAAGATLNSTVRDFIAYSNTTYDLIAFGSNPTITESNYGTNSGWTIGAGCITTNPQFCKISIPYELGISADSGAYRTDTSSDDMGAHLRIVEINNDSIIVNGFIIDGQEQYNNAIFIVDTADHTGTEIRWNTICQFQGIAIDLYDDGTDTDAIIKNCKIYYNGNGIKFTYGGNDVEENLIYSNTIFGIWSNQTGQTFNHNVFYDNQYGIYLESSSAGFIYTNNISMQNSLYGIYSEVAFAVSDNDIYDATYNIDTTDGSNITDDPLFVNTNAGSEDFNIKTLEAGYPVESPCKDAASDGYDIGAYLMSRSVNNDSWRKYTLVDNPYNVNEELLGKGIIQFDSALGSMDRWMKSNKRILPLQFGSRQASTAEMRKKLQYLSQLVPSRENGLKVQQCVMRYHFKPAAYMASGTNATVNATSKTVTDSSKTWVEDEYKGFHVGVKYDKDTGNGTIAAAGKTLTVAPSPVWTVNEWAGYYFYYGGYYYYIKSNTANVLTLSDPDSTLSDAASINWTIEKYFKIESNTSTALQVTDDNSELVTGTYDYYIDFIEVRSVEPRFKYTQVKHDIDLEVNKTGYSLTLEEV